jgi:hypothetical protein
MKKLLALLSIAVAFTACNSKVSTSTTPDDKDTLKYAYKATYSSDITSPGNKIYAQKVLQVWKMFETANIQAMKPYFADSVRYDAADGMHFYGPTDQLLAYAKKDIDGLDSMRFDIFAWQSAHINDKNEEWVNIWARERRYPKKGSPDTVLMQENWQVKAGKVVEFNQFTSKN